MMKLDPIDERGLPSSIETEKLIIAALLKGTLDYRDCRAVLAPEDFALEAHRTIYHHCDALMTAAREIDLMTISDSLMRSSQLDGVGGLSYLIDLENNMPGLPRLDSYIQIVRDKSILRKTIYLADSIRKEAILGTGDAPELLGRAERMLADLGMEAARASEFLDPSEVIRAKGGINGYLDRGMEMGVPTGYAKLDEMTCGLRPGHLWMLAAATSGGKSTFARNVALNAARRHYPGAIITLEMTDDEVTDGLICAAGQINTQIIRRGLAFERDKIRAAMMAVADLPIYIRDQGGVTIPKMHGELRKLKAEKGIQWAIIDYLQLMTPVGRFGNRTEEIGHLSRGLKLIAQDLKIGLVALSQLTREPSKMKRRPELSDLREGGSIENDSNLVLFLYSEWQASAMEEYPTEVIIAKQRGGPIGIIPFGFRKSTGTFIEHSEGAA